MGRGTTVYADEHASYFGLPVHEKVNHKRGEYVRGAVNTNGTESVCTAHLQRYVDELARLNNQRPLTPLARMGATAKQLAQAIFATAIPPIRASTGHRAARRFAG